MRRCVPAMQDAIIVDCSEEEASAGDTDSGSATSWRARGASGGNGTLKLESPLVQILPFASLLHCELPPGNGISIFELLNLYTFAFHENTDEYGKQFHIQLLILDAAFSAARSFLGHKSQRCNQGHRCANSK